MNRDKKDKKTLFPIALRFLIIAIVAISSVTAAWFSIADRTRVGLTLEITPGLNLKVDTVSHMTIDEYPKSLGFSEIEAYINSVYGYSLKDTPLQPVTSDDGVNFYLKDGTRVSADKGYFNECVLHFMANREMLVNITTNSSSDGDDGTLLTSTTSDTIINAIRMSLTDTDGNTVIYKFTESGNTPAFMIGAETDKPITMRIWLEGTDPYCTNDLKGTDFNFRLRFLGTDENGNPLK